MGQWCAAFMPLHRSAADNDWSNFGPSTLRELKRHKCRAPSIKSKPVCTEPLLELIHMTTKMLTLIWERIKEFLVPLLLSTPSQPNVVKNLLIL